MTTTPRNHEHVMTLDRQNAAPRRQVGWIVAGSLLTGLVVGLLLVAAAPFIEPKDREVTGALLLGFAVGWAVLAVLSRTLTDQPQRWAAAPAAFMGVSGLVLIGLSSTVHDVLDWVWPPGLLGLVVWMFVSARRQLHSRSRRWLLYPVFATLALASVAGGYATVHEAVDARAEAMPGQLVDVGGHKLHLHCAGSGSPTVVLEPGAGESSSSFDWIAPVVAKDSRACVYDRAGRGWSEPADSPQDAAQISVDLRTALQRADIPEPYVLGGHSFGGLYVLTYAARYPDDVAGMVLIDSTAPKTPPSEAPTSSELTARISALLSASAHLGIASTASSLRSTIDEYVQGNASTGQAGALTDFADKPLIVLTATVGNGKGWEANQDKLATLSTNSAHREVDGATHASMVHDKEDAAATTRAILDVLAAVRSSSAVR
jgi:pimeloyl-ACP methyl ester carboxylesterase